MSDTQQGAGWWQASDGKWYAPELHPNYAAASAPAASGEAPPSESPAPAPEPAYTAPAPGYATPGYASPGYAAAPPVAPPPGGYAYPPGGYQSGLPSAKYSGLAIASLVLSIVWLGGIGAILAVIFAIVSLRHIAASQGRLRGRGLSIAGLIIGIIGIIGAAITWSVVAWVGANARHVTVPIGRTVNVSDSFSLGISTMQISAVHRVDQLSGSTAGHYVVADVRICAGNSGSRTGVFDSAFFLNTDNGNSVSGSTSVQQKPDIGNGSVPSNTCVTGHVTFKVNSDSTSVRSIDYHGFVPSTYTWTIPTGF
ncbi:MAG TPA: DUF4190 domain-containing protein [Acidimicrobiales bacterium]|jgi:hypothetical protein|nr:DUF4190 domain-containing protein [Acidimicrobiales bacterium]